MLECYAPTTDACPLQALSEFELPDWLERQTPRVATWVRRTQFKAKSGSFSLVPAEDGSLERVVFGTRGAEDFWALGALAEKLPEGDYALQCDWEAADVRRALLAWGLGAYHYGRYKERTQPAPRLVLASEYADVEGIVRGAYLVRDLINTPAADMMPQNLGHAARELATDFGAHVEEVVGDDLLEQNYPAIHAVGRASAHPPRLIDLRWGEDEHPRLTLVGKGVCFDTGGLDLKPASAMRLMKKDMGGAAHALGLAHMIMAAGLPVRLRVLVAAADNAVSGDAFRPGDVLASRKGLSIEVDNTDAEGRLVLCDALAEGGTENPELMIDFATLTGAARVALGTEIPVFFTDADELAATLMAHGQEEGEPLWRLPLHKPYEVELKSRIADIVNCASGSYAGAITAALFLRRFVPEVIDWIHFDIMAWNRRARPGRPKGGEAMGLYALFAYLKTRYAP